MRSFILPTTFSVSDGEGAPTGSLKIVDAFTGLPYVPESDEVRAARIRDMCRQSSACAITIGDKTYCGQCGYSPCTCPREPSDVELLEKRVKALETEVRRLRRVLAKGPP